ncbi:MAG TPA: peptidoglycan recognition protein, partial [Actinomycetota bacterium]|nr:peptidoglycan recognition protein [Actinomycetota bacterium]
KMAFIHHTDTTNSYTKSQSAGIVRGIYAYHTNSRGYCDIGYNFIVDKYGQIFEGRSGGITNNVIGAHTGGYNYESFGVSLLGQYSAAKPTTAMLNALTYLLAWRLDIGHVPATGLVYMTTGSGNDHTKAGTVVRLNRIAGHRDVSYTNCPGNNVYSLMTWIRSRVKGIGLPKIYNPMLDSTLVRRDGDTKNEMVRFTAQFSGTVTWTLKFIDPKGVAQRTISGTGSGVKVYWGGQTLAGAPVPNGRYTWTLNAWDSTRHSATGASGVLNVVSSHPDGTLLQDATGKYVIMGGVARAVDPTTYRSNFGTLPAVQTGPNERARYTSGSPLGLREGTILTDSATPTPQYYIWDDGALHAFKNESFTALGYSAAAAIPASADYIASLGTLGTPITSLTQHPDGTLVKSSDGKSFWVIEGAARRPISALARASWYRSSEAVLVAVDDPITAGSAFPVRDGTFIKATDGGAPWIVSDGTKHRFVSSDFAAMMGFTSTMMLTGTAADINAIPTGARVG